MEPFWIMVGLILATPAPPHPDIWVQPASAAPQPHEAAELPWLDVEPTRWEHPPLARLASDASNPNAVIWVAMTQQHLHVHVVVYDAHHENDQSGDAIWNGDAVLVSVDPRGDAKNLARQMPQALQPGSLSASFALTRHGVRSWAHTRAAPETSGPLTTPTRIERDAGHHITTYDVILPWQVLHCAPGESATLGLQVAIHDRDALGQLRRATLGDSPTGTFDASRFKTLALGEPPHPVLTLTPQRLDVWRITDAACAMVISQGEAAFSADVGFADTHRTLHWQNHGAALRRWQICVGPKRLLEAPVSWSVSVSPGDKAASVHGTYIVKSPSWGLEQDLAAIGTLASSAATPLAKRHLESTYALLQSLWSMAITTLDDGDTAAQEAATAISQSRSHLPPRADSLERALQRGERPLLATFVSREDRTLQPYTLVVPRVVDASQGQAAMVFLQDQGAPGLGQFVADAQLSHDAPWEHTYVLHPWVRGNMSSRGFVETDVLDAVAHANSLFRFDRDRIYLGGSATGGTGAWRVGLHHPDIWAALAIFAGHPAGVPMGVGFGANVAHLPVYLHHGLRDAADDDPSMRAMQDELEKSGAKPEMALEQGSGGRMTEQHQQLLRAWTNKHIRQAPKTMRYTSDEAGQTAWGITLRHDPKLAAFPRFVAHSNDRQLRIDTVGTAGMDVDLSARALGCAGGCRVFWNGVQVHDGDPALLHLGLGA